MLSSRAFLELTRLRLARLKRRHPAISACYLRHSAAFEAPNPLLADIDLTFLLNLKDPESFAQERKTIAKKMDQSLLLGRLTRDRIFLPNTEQALALCEEVYPFRSAYPMGSWIAIDERTPSNPPPVRQQFPLDHLPESFLHFYLVRTALENKRRPFERAFIRRKLLKDTRYIHGAKQATANHSPDRAGDFDKALMLETRLWHEFFGKLQYPSRGEPVRVENCERLSISRFTERWSALRQRILSTLPESVSSVWIYPSAHRDRHPYIALNFFTDAKPEDFRRGLAAVQEAFSGFRYSPLPGTETSMLGRINGLSRLSLFEPWFFLQNGACLFGDSVSRERIVEPSIEMVRTKHREFALYTCYRWLSTGAAPSYPAYRLLYTTAHLMRSNELIIDDEKLSQVFGGEYVLEEAYNSSSAGALYLSALKTQHNIDLFNSGGSA